MSNAPDIYHQDNTVTQEAKRLVKSEIKLSLPQARILARDFLEQIPDIANVGLDDPRYPDSQAKQIAEKLIDQKYNEDLALAGLALHLSGRFKEKDVELSGGPIGISGPEIANAQLKGMLEMSNHFLSKLQGVEPPVESQEWGKMSKLMSNAATVLVNQK